MPASLYDITIYYWGARQNDALGNWKFAKKSNFICDFYQKMLFGYKPPKTTRICIHINDTKNFEEPVYNGSICAIARAFDEEAFSKLSELCKYELLLDIVHDCCIELSEKYGWLGEPFQKAYEGIKRADFVFVIDYPAKQSKDKKKKANVQVSKTENTSTIHLIFSFDGQTKTIKLFEKKNWFWVDSVYEMAENSKWLDTSTFGVYSKRNDKVGYYSLIDDVIIGKLDFKDTDF